MYMVGISRKRKQFSGIRYKKTKHALQFVKLSDSDPILLKNCVVQARKNTSLGIGYLCLVGDFIKNNQAHSTTIDIVTALAYPPMGSGPKVVSIEASPLEG